MTENNNLNEMSEDKFDDFEDEIFEMAGCLKVAAKDLWECSMNRDSPEEKEDLLNKLAGIRELVAELYAAVEALEV